MPSRQTGLVALRLAQSNLACYGYSKQLDVLDSGYAGQDVWDLASGDSDGVLDGLITSLGPNGPAAIVAANAFSNDLSVIRVGR